MLTEQDLRTAIERGIITQQQAQDLTSLAEQNPQIDAAYYGSEERFRFFKGFNEIFLAIGLLIFIGGLNGTVFAGSAALAWLGLLGTPIVIWLLAEYFILRKLSVLPGIVLAALFGFSSGLLGLLALKIILGVEPALAQGLLEKTDELTETVVAVGLSAGALVGAILFYLRFRVPFTLLVAGGAFVVLVLNLLVLLGLQKSAGDSVWLILLLGVGVFTAAMLYDVADPLRKTRTAVCGFWLHLLAAPLIVHAVMASTGITFDDNAFDTRAAVIIVALVLLLSLVALAVDRRALLVSALTYFGWAISHFVERAGIDNAFVMILTLLLLGGVVLVLGTGWPTLRAMLLAPVRNHVPFKYLPPVSLST